MSGAVGKIVNNLLFGLFGIIAYVAPIILFAIVYVYVSNRESIFATRKCVSAFGIITVICSLIQLNGYDDSVKLTEFYSISKTDRTGGGFIGGLFCKLSYRLFGVGGSIVLLLLIAVICLIVITDQMLFDMVKNAYKSVVTKMETADEKFYDAKETDYVEYVNVTEEDEEAPKRRPAQTYTFERVVSESETEIVKPDEVIKDEIIEINPKKNIVIPAEETEDVVEDIIDNSTPIDVNSNMDIESTEIYEQELNNKFNNGKSNDIEDYDILNMADDLVNDRLKDDYLSVCEITNDSDNTETLLIEKSEEETKAEDIQDNTDAEVSILHVIEDKNNQPQSKMEKKMANEGTIKPANVSKKYKFPPASLLIKLDDDNSDKNSKEHIETAKKLQETFDSFGVRVTITNISCGPSVTRYEVQPDQGVKVSKVTNLSDDIKLNLAAADIRIEAPIPGKAAIGIEVPNKDSNSTVYLKSLLESKVFKASKSSLSFAVGKDIAGQEVIADIAKMPHLLIAGQTGSGKSVCINTLIMSILYKAHPDDVKLIMIDPKVVELSVYNGIPHLLIPVVTDPKKASGALNWAVAEMTERYNKFAELGVRDIAGFNKKVTSVPDNDIPRYQKMSKIVIIVDELADLMMVAPGEVEDAICRLAQMARAAGIHLIIATQRPSVNVITGLIKANIPSRIAFSVTSAIDSRTIIDGSGAEKLLGKGDMLFFPASFPKPVRVQGAFVTDNEVNDVVDFLKNQNYQSDDAEDIDSKIESVVMTSVQTQELLTAKNENSKDDYFVQAGRCIIEKDKASIGMLQRVYKIGFNRAARIMDQLCEAGVVGPEEGTKPRKILMTSEEFDKYIEECL
ncbi:MAG: DNA translocase FtsK [Lachnospiraceae bacterium]|nr:DNA translocase FtsK [Lachnospiraceae bacterium]